MQLPGLSDSFHIRCNGVDHDLDGFKRMWNTRKVLLGVRRSWPAPCIGAAEARCASIHARRTRPPAGCMLAPTNQPCCHLPQKLLQSVEFELLDLFERGDSVSAI